MSEQGKHTPGPWWVDEPLEEGGFEPVVCSESWVICELAEGSEAEGEMEANADLIAAAPDLLAALLELVPVMDKAESDASGTMSWEWVSRRINAARAAIFKARGGV